MFGKRKRNNLYCIEMSHSEEWLIFFYTRKQKGMIEQRGLFSLKNKGVGSTMKLGIGVENFDKITLYIPIYLDF